MPEIENRAAGEFTPGEPDAAGRDDAPRPASTYGPLWIALFVLSFALGAYLRLSHLGATPMSADEGASWASASAPSISEVVSRQQSLNAGKLPFHDLTLHFWIAAVGQRLGAMRLSSAIAGLLAVLLIIPVTREIIRLDRPRAVRLGRARFVAGMALAICATSLIAIKYSREMRMYSLMLAAAELQVWAFVRTVRAARLGACVFLMLTTAMLIAINTIAAPLAAAEVAWLIFGLSLRWEIVRMNAARAFLSLFAGIAALAPALAIAGSRVGARVSAGGFRWLQIPPWWAPMSLLSKAEGTFVFPVVAILAGWGIWRVRARMPIAISFLAAWMVLPPVLLVIGSHLYHPMFLERYLVYVFPPLFILCALGIWEIPGKPRIAAAVLVIALSLGHVYSYSRKSHGVDWAQGAVAAAHAAGDRAIAVMPGYAVSVVRYYTPADRRDRVIAGGKGSGETAAVLVISPPMLHNNPAIMTEAHREFPVLIQDQAGVAVFSRTPAAGTR